MVWLLSLSVLAVLLGAVGWLIARRQKTRRPPDPSSDIYPLW